MNFRLWSSEDDKTLKRMFDAGCDDVAISERMGRTVKAIEGRRKRLNLSRYQSRQQQKAPRQRARTWPDKEIDMLVIAINAGWSDNHIAQMLNRTPQSVKGKRESLEGGMQRERLAASVEAKAGWPMARNSERERGEALLTKMLGGHKGRDTRPASTWQPQHMPDLRQPHGSSTAWCAG